MGESLHLRGVVLPDEEPTDLWIHDGLISLEPIASAATIVDSGWIMPGLVDAHCHVGLRFGGGDEDRDGAVAQAGAEREAGALLLRDAGSPIDTRFIDEREDLPKIIRAGRHIAKTKRYAPGLAVNADDENLLPDLVAEQARFGDGWVKLVGDWIDRSVGDLAPLWSDEILTAAIDAAHREGARVTAHVFGEDALPGLIGAGIDCIEHGTGLSDATISMMVSHGTALVPTLINIATFPDIVSGAGKYPAYQRHMLDLHKRVHATIGKARDAGVPIYAGTDAGSGIVHGRIADEVLELTAIGMSPSEALGAASWDARKWLGHGRIEYSGIEHGASADLVAFATDPRSDVRVLAAPDVVILRGQRY